MKLEGRVAPAPDASAFFLGGPGFSSDTKYKCRPMRLFLRGGGNEKRLRQRMDRNRLQFRLPVSRVSA